MIMILIDVFIHIYWYYMRRFLNVFFEMNTSIQKINSTFFLPDIIPRKSHVLINKPQWTKFKNILPRVLHGNKEYFNNVCKNVIMQVYTILEIAIFYILRVITLQSREIPPSISIYIWIENVTSYIAKTVKHFCQFKKRVSISMHGYFFSIPNFPFLSNLFLVYAFLLPIRTSFIILI